MKRKSIPFCRGKVALGVLLAFLILISSGLTGYGGISVTPLLLDLSINPGSSGGGKLTVQNTGTEALHIESQIRGFRTSERGVAQFLSGSAAEKYPFSGEDFLTLKPAEAVLQGGESKEFTYEVSYPKDTEPFGGRYVGALFKATPAEKKKEESKGSSIEVATRVGTLILLRPSEEILVGKKFREFVVNPEIVDLSMRKVYDGRRLLISTTLKNSGNIHIRKEEFEGTVHIENSAGEHLDQLDISAHNILPETTYALNELWQIPEELKDETKEAYRIRVQVKVKTPFEQFVEIEEEIELEM